MNGVLFHLIDYSTFPHYRKLINVRGCYWQTLGKQLKDEEDQISNKSFLQPLINTFLEMFAYKNVAGCRTKK